MAGQTFTVRNSDPVLHNINSTRAKNNKGKNFAQPTKGHTTDMSFLNPEVAIQFRANGIEQIVDELKPMGVNENGK